jgi:hypothetical protein
LSQFQLRAGGADITAQGDVSDMAGAMKAQLDGKLGPMPVNVLKMLWPNALAPRTHDWVAQRLVRGHLQGGSFKLVSGHGGASAGDRVSLTLEGTNLAFAVVDGWPLVEAPRGLARLETGAFELTVPEATLAGADGRRLALKGSFSIDMAAPVEARVGQLVLRAQGPLPTALDLMDREPFRLLQGSGITVAGADGKIDAQLTFLVPLGDAVQARDIRVEGKTRVSEGRLAKGLGPYDIHGANLVFDATQTAVEAKGEMLVSGVLAKASWQHVFGAPAERQPPLRLTADLDNSDRTRLGLDINDIVQGEVGVEVTVAQDARNERRVHVRADLANAELLLESVAWRKPRGRGSVFQFDVAKGTGAYPAELRNVTLVGDNVALQGWMGLGADHRPKEFHFPVFSLNVVTSLDVNGKLRGDAARGDNVWDVTAKGPRYDGRDLFRSFFDVDHTVDPNAKSRPGLDLRAEIDTVVGFSDATLRKVVMTLKKRAGRLTYLDATGALEGDRPFKATVRHEQGRARRLHAETSDAGQLFKLVGFYPNAVGGTMNLEVNLDGEGAAERTGLLGVTRFVVLGDPVVGQVLQNADDPRPASQSGPGQRRTVVRERFEFDTLHAPFSVGHGQFVLHTASIKGPLVSATMRGKVDFRAQSLQLGGSYVPMSVIMQIPAPLPFLGPVLTGVNGEGLFGVTFAILGSMRDPQVTANPLSIFTPGIFREIMQMTPENPRVIPREKAGVRGDAARASSAPPASVPGAVGPSVAPEVGEGWSAHTSETGTAKKK